MQNINLFVAGTAAFVGVGCGTENGSATLTVAVRV
jgi:hypothetical protein